MLEKLGVSSSGYYDWLNRSPSKQAIRKKVIKEEIEIEYEASKQIYGAPKITKKLQQKGFTVSEKTVGNYMKEMNIRAIYRNKWIQTTVDSDFSSELKNMLKRNFTVSEPNIVWVTDITYIWTFKGFVYLTSVMDLFSRKIIAWELTDNLSVKGVIKCILKAKKRRNIDKPLIIHSDRGKQYVSKEYIKLFNKNIKRSYSNKANPWDNACMESFHAIIKREWLSRYRIKNIDHAYQLVFEFIETFYNTIRIHGSLDYASPNQYEKSYQQDKNIN